MIDASLIFDGTVNTTPNTGVTGTAVTATRASTNVIDFLTGRDLGVDSLLGIHVMVTEAFATLTSLQVDFEVCDTAGGTFLALALSPVTPVAQLIIGCPLFRVALPLNQVLNATAGVLKTPGQYCQLRYTVAGSNATAGKVFSWIAPNNDRQQYWSYPSGYTAY